MGCGASKQTVNTVQDGAPMEEIKPAAEVSVDKGKAKSQELAGSSAGKKSAQDLTKASSADKLNNKGVAFEIPVDDLKVPSAQLIATNRSVELDPEQLKEKLKAKEEQAEENRLKQLEQIQAKAAKRDENVKKAADRRKENGSAGNLSTGGEAGLDGGQKSKNASQANLTDKAEGGI